MNRLDSLLPTPPDRAPPAPRPSGRLPAIDPARCTGCGRCVAACEPRLLSLETVRWQKSSVLHDADRCTGCSLCAVKCPFHAITMRSPDRMGGHPRMKLAIDVHYEGEGAQAAVAFDDWAAPEPLRSYISRIAHVEPAPRGQLDLRELPCVMQLLREHALQPELIVIDGFVHLDAQETPGLGAYLHHALEGRVAIVGVSKTALPGLPAQFEVMREEETRPLIVTCVGIDLGAAKTRLRAMHGRKRLPTLLKLATRLAKHPAA